MIQKKGNNMIYIREFYNRQGKIGYLLAWAVGVPVPILLLIFVLRGCD